MRTLRRLPWLPSTLGVLALLVGVAAGPGSSRESARFGPGSAPTITATGLLGSATSAPDARLQREIESGKGQRLSRHDALASPASIAPSTRASVQALAGALERAGHPERIGQILLRGPPATSA